MEKKPGLIRRFFSLIGKIVSAIRTLINLIILLVFIAIIASLFQQEVQPLHDKAALRLAIGGVLVDEKTRVPPLGKLLGDQTAIDAETVVSTLVESIKKATTDSRITSLVLELDNMTGGGISKLDEIGDAISLFKQSGKPVIAVGDNYNQQQYYLASFADEIYLNPMGAVLLTGFGSYPTYMKDALDKLKIHVNVFRVGEYKDAIEPFTRNNMSDASRSHTEAWLQDFWRAYTSRVEAKRNLPRDAINDYVNNLAEKLADHNGNAAELALASGLVDHLAARPAMLERLQQVAGYADSDSYQYIDHQQYAGLEAARPSAIPLEQQPMIGFVVAKGVMVDGYAYNGDLGSSNFVSLMQQVRTQRPAALVLRIDSPGGSAFAAEVMRREIELTRSQGIPIVVSMGSVAASGGYWIATAADEILATPTTLTGSIGVFGILPTFEDSFASLGIYSDGVGTTELADFYQLNRPLSEQAQRVIQLSVEDIYRRFLTLVATSRDSTPAAIHQLAQGRVWGGQKALEMGLVDKLGTLETAIAEAAKKAGVANFRVEKITEPLGYREQLLEALSGAAARVMGSNTAVSWLPESVSRLLKPLSESEKILSRLNDPRRLYLQCFECVSH